MNNQKGAKTKTAKISAPYVFLSYAFSMVQVKGTLATLTHKCFDNSVSGQDMEAIKRARVVELHVLKHAQTASLKLQT